MEALCMEEVWFTLAMTRLSIIKRIDGGISHIVKVLLKRLFFNAGGNNFQVSGIARQFWGGGSGR